MFRISVSSGSSFPCDLAVKAPVISGKKEAHEFNLFLRGIIRSVWHDVSKDISVKADSDILRGIVSDLSVVMSGDEGITFRED